MAVSVLKPKDLRTIFKNKGMAQNIFKATAHFNLRDKKAEYSLVYMVVNIDHKQYKTSTGMYVRPKQWDYKKEECIVSDKIPNLDKENNLFANSIFSRLKFAFDKNKIYLCNNHPAMGYENNDFCKTILNMKKSLQNTLTARGVKVRKPKMEKAWCFEDWVNNAIGADRNITDSSKDVYRAKIKVFGQYLAERKTTLNDLRQIDKKMLRGYNDWLLGRTQTNTANENLKKLLTILNKYAVKDELLEATEVANLMGYAKSIKTKGEVSYDEVALRDDEVMALLRHECKNRTEELVRDVFVLNCLTGQRLSDSQKVIEGYETINGQGYFHLTQQKTHATVCCPVKFKAAEDILRKYKGTGIKIPKKEVFNKCVKDIAKTAGLNRPCTHVEQHGAKVTTVEKPLYQKISSHTGRRTFITMLSLRGVSVNEIQDYSGHKNSKMVEHYSKTDPMERSLFNNLPVGERLEMTGGTNNVTSGTQACGSVLEAYRETANIAEYKRLLCFVGVQPEQYEDLETFDDVCRLFFKAEDRLLSEGISVEAIKGLYNAQNKSLAERKEALHRMVAEMRGCVKIGTSSFLCCFDNET